MVETVIGAAVISLVLFSLAQVAQFSFRTVAGANFKLRSAFLAEEGIEAVRIIRDLGWAANIAPLASNSNYYLQFAGGVWTLTALSQPKVDGIFDRRVVFSAVNRDASDNIVSSGGVLDPDTKKVTVDVAYNNRGRVATTTVSIYITNFFNN